ncbi:MAG: hypothetical protein WD960_01325 [Gemmatimonadota bacterium]
MHDIHVPSDIQARYLPRRPAVSIVIGALSLVGFASFAFLLTADPDRAWQAYVSNWLFFTGIALGAIILGVATTITKAKWNWSIRRVGLAFGAFLPVSLILLVPMLLGLRENYFPWIAQMAYDPIVQAKAAYLNIPFLVTRNVVGALLLFGMALTFVYWALRPDLGPDREQDEGGDPGRARWRDRLSAGWLGQAEEEARSTRRLRVLAPALALVYAFVMSIFVVDWAMSLESHWFSTMMPVWYSMGSFWGGITATAVVVVLLKKLAPDFDEAMGPQQLHDIGKLIFGFSIFWAYLAFSQYIVIWYGKLPWEQAWMIRRSGPEWGPYSLATVALCFGIPFAALIGRLPKMIPGWLGAIGFIALVGLWLERHLLVLPSLHETGTATMTLWEPLIGLGFLGVFVGSIRWFLSTFPVIQMWQPVPEPEMVDLELPRETTAQRG